MRPAGSDIAFSTSNFHFELISRFKPRYVSFVSNFRSQVKWACIGLGGVWITYFDEAGLLVRIVRWNSTASGVVPTQIDYSDYRDVAGVKMPYKILMTWTDGQNTFSLTDIQPNVAINAARFARPAPFTRR